MLAVLIRIVRTCAKIGAYILAASKTASLVESSASFSFSSSALASCRPFPTAAPWYPCTTSASGTAWRRGTVTYKKNTAGFHDVEIRPRFVHSAEDRADTKRSNGGIQGIDLNILSETLCYILQSGHQAELCHGKGAPTLTCGGEW